jgi:hypothetical protein
MQFSDLMHKCFDGQHDCRLMTVLWKRGGGGGPVNWTGPLFNTDSQVKQSEIDP